MKEYLKDFPEKEKLDKLIKYQILDENISLYAEIELSNKITEEMKSKIIDNEHNKYLLLYDPDLRKPNENLCYSVLGTPLYMDPMILKKINSNCNYKE